MAPGHWLSCRCASAGAKESVSVRRTEPSLNLEISARCWLFHAHTTAQHLMII